MKKRIGAISMLALSSISFLAPFVGKFSNTQIVNAATQDNNQHKLERPKMNYQKRLESELSKIIEDVKNSKKKWVNNVLSSNIDETYYERVAQEHRNVLVETFGEEYVDGLEFDNYIEYGTPSNNSFKSYMSLNTITDTSSPQYALKLASETDMNTGIQVINGRYLIAVGSGYCTQIGTYIDVVMENGSVVPCIMGDMKADEHTDSTNKQNKNGSIIEFIVNPNYLPDVVVNPNYGTGNISDCDERLIGEIEYIRVYE